MRSFKNGFKKARKEAGYTQESFAQKFNFSPSTIKNWEQGKSIPEIGTILNLCKIFNCDIDYLFNNIEMPTHDLQFIYEHTGITKEAIKKLQSLKNDREITTYNFEKMLFSFYSSLITDKEIEDILKYNMLEMLITSDEQRKNIQDSPREEIYRQDIKMRNDFSRFQIEKAVAAFLERFITNELENFEV